MKPIKRLYLSGEEIAVSDINLVLELSSCGRGFVTAQTTKDYTGKLVRLDVGYSDLLLQWFTGYVERSQPAENGYSRLFVRELVGVFDRPWPCSFQHPTLKIIADWLFKKSGLSILLSDKGDNNKPIPHFTHTGSGYQLLANLGKAFSINDYVWFQMPDGGLYIGGSEGALFAGKPVMVPPEFSRGSAGGNTMILPVIQSVRPGVELNNQRVTSVRLHDDEMSITWTPRDKKTGKALQKSLAQRQVEASFPELAAGLHLPKFARVEAPSEAVTGGDISDPFRPRYAVDIQMLDENGNPAKDTPIFSAVPLPVPMAGTESGMFHFPPAGTIVEVGFTDGRPDRPFIRQTMADGHNLPNIMPGEQLQQQRAEVFQRVTVSGDWVRKTDQKIEEASTVRSITADEEIRALVTRKTVIQATDEATVLGISSLRAGAITNLAESGYCLAVGGDHVSTVGGNETKQIDGTVNINTGSDLIEKIGTIRRSVAAARQELIAPAVWVGSEQLNLLQLMLDTLDVVKQLAESSANHTHQDTGSPLNAGDIAQAGAKAGSLRSKYQSLVG